MRLIFNNNFYFYTLNYLKNVFYEDNSAPYSLHRMAEYHKSEAFDAWFWYFISNLIRNSKYYYFF